MRIILLIIVMALAGPVHAGGEDVLAALLTGGLAGNNAPEGKRYLFGILRLSGGYAQSEIYNLKPEAKFSRFADGRGTWGELDFGAILAMHFGFTQLADNHAQADFNGGGLRDAKISFDKYKYGLKFVLPIVYINPWVGAGVSSGQMTVRDPEGTVPKEHSRLTGHYWHCGLDILFSPYVGLRLSYTKDFIKTRKFDIFGNTPVEFNEHLGQGGLLLYF